MFNIGIDTGGTYTDAVVVDPATRSIVASAKATTTHGDLSLGVSNALRASLQQLGDTFSHDNISLVSVSTTLATNALVEGQGGAVATILIGFDETLTQRTHIAEAVPGTRVLRINGGHDHAGEESVPLDETALVAAIDSVANDVDAFAIGSLYSTRNASHEHRAAELVRKRTSMPVTISSDLSDELDGPRRALTATLNARIISRIVSLITAVRQSLQKESIHARLMIVRGDGSLADADLVAKRPIETILSGPAASVIGARYLCREQNFIISDIGGTTTDIAVAHEGWPDVNEKGSMVGQHRTLVHAIDMTTVGLGGDSEVLVDYAGNISLSENRVVPISLLGSRWTSVAQHLQAVLLAGISMRAACRFIVRPEGYDASEINVGLNAGERKFLARTGDEPQPWSAIVHRLSDEKHVSKLRSRGLIQLAGFTPSDAAHVLGKQSQWSTETAMLACQILGQSCDRISRNNANLEGELPAFAEALIDAVIQKSCHVMLERLCQQTFEADEPFVHAITTGSAKVGDIAVSLAPNIPLIAVGGPANLYYPDVGRRLGTKTIIPDHSPVANAIGAAVGLVKAHAAIEITPHDSGAYYVHIDEDPIVVQSATAALQKARQTAVERAECQAALMGATSTETTVDVNRVDLPDCEGDNGLVAATITAESVGSPW